MKYFPLLSISLLYFLIAFLKPYIQPKIKFNLCAICISTALTWLILSIFWLLGLSADVLHIAVLMGMSVVGIMYKLEKIYKEKNIKNFWLVRIIIVLGGLYSIDSFLNKNWNLLSFIFIVSLIGISIASLLFQSVDEKELDEKSLKKRLENCC